MLRHPAGEGHAHVRIVSGPALVFDEGVDVTGASLAREEIEPPLALLIRVALLAHADVGDGPGRQSVWGLAASVREAHRSAPGRDLLGDVRRIPVRVTELERVCRTRW